MYVMIFLFPVFFLPAAGKDSPIDERDKSQNYPFVFATIISWSLINAPAPLPPQKKTIACSVCRGGFRTWRYTHVFDPGSGGCFSVGGKKCTTVCFVLCFLGIVLLYVLCMFSVCSLCVFRLCLMVLCVFFVSKDD